MPIQITIMQNKIQTIYSCSKCGAQALKWSGRCLECGAWGTLDKSQEPNPKSQNLNQSQAAMLTDFSDVRPENFQRIKTNISELDCVLGGGIVKGSLILLGGEPGIGKSTIILQIAQSVPEKIIYVSGEESKEQIKMRIDRLGIKTTNLKFLGDTNIDVICATLKKEKPVLAIIDSIQTMFTNDVMSEAGNISQVRACTVKLLEVAKQHNISIIIIGHVTKDGSVAGPKTLEHLVDTVLYLEGDEFHHYRLLRGVKNRFGSTNEIGIFDMTKNGLIEVKNPSQTFLQDMRQKTSGSAVTCVIEGTRPFLTEVQSLVTTTVFGYPQRKASGFDINRLQLLIAVLNKRANLNLTNQDVHLNIVGGFKINEPAIDLAIALAIAGAYKNIISKENTAVFGEIGLGGEIRPINFLERRIMEAQKMGYEKIICPDMKTEIKSNKIFKVKNILQAIELI